MFAIKISQVKAAAGVVSVVSLVIGALAILVAYQQTAKEDLRNRHVACADLLVGLDETIYSLDSQRKRDEWPVTIIGDSVNGKVRHAVQVSEHHWRRMEVACIARDIMPADGERLRIGHGHFTLVKFAMYHAADMRDRYVKELRRWIYDTELTLRQVA